MNPSPALCNKTNVTYTIPQMDNLWLLGSVSYQSNDSNLDINNYIRTLYSVSITKRFCTNMAAMLAFGY